MTRGLRVFGAALLLLGAAGLAAGLYRAGEGDLTTRARRLFLLGGPVLHVRVPTPEQIVSVGAAEILVSFAPGQVAADTFRCLLNDRDITDTLTLGRNGAGGSVVGLIEGRNELRVEVFSRTLWSRRYVQDTQTVTFYVKGLVAIDRA